MIRIRIIGNNVLRYRFFLRLEADSFIVLFCHQTFVKVRFHDKVTGFLAFEDQMPIQTTPLDVIRK